MTFCGFRSRWITFRPCNAITPATSWGSVARSRVGAYHGETIRKTREYFSGMPAEVVPELAGAALHTFEPRFRIDAY